MNPWVQISCAAVVTVCAALAISTALTNPSASEKTASDKTTEPQFFQTSKTVDSSKLQTAGAAINGYRKPGAPVQLQFFMDENTQVGNRSTLTTVWTVEEDSELMNVQIISADEMALNTPPEITLAAPITGEKYTLNIDYTALKGRHEVNLIATTSNNGKSEVRTFAIALETDDASDMSLKPGIIVRANDGEWLHTMTTSPQ